MLDTSRKLRNYDIPPVEIAMNNFVGTTREFASKGYEFHQSFSDKDIATKYAKDFEADSPLRNVIVVRTKGNMWTVMSKPKIAAWKNLTGE